MPLLSSLFSRSFASVCERVREYFAPRGEGPKNIRRARRLLIDPLEERQLLSVTADVGITIDTGDVEATSGQSIATDDNGDAVVVWTATDYTWDAELDTYVFDTNIYAEYLTHNVQEITLAEGTTSFYLVYGGSTITQTISFEQDSIYTDDWVDISGYVKLTFGSDSVTFYYNSYSADYYAALLQTYLHTSGIEQLEGAVVTATDDYTFTIEYEAAFEFDSNNDLVEQTYLAIDQGATSLYNADYPEQLASVNIATTSVPTVIGKIKVSSSNAASTVAAITSYMEGTDTEDSEQTAPTTVVGPESETVTTDTTLAVTVTSVSTEDDPYGLYHFQITFDGDVGYGILDELIIVNAKNSAGADVTNECSVDILKQSSEVFRVNPTEVDDVYTEGLDLTDQYNAVVAMDGDGDFVISWVSEATDGTTNVYARRFTTQAYVDEDSTAYLSGGCWSYQELTDSYLDDGDLVAVYSTVTIQSVRPVAAPDDADNLTVVEVAVDAWTQGTSSTLDLTLVNDGSTFQVNTLVPNSYGTTSEEGIYVDDSELSIAMDAEGNFVIVWASAGQNYSYFNQVYGRGFYADGTPMDVETLLTGGAAIAYSNPYVTISEDDVIAIVWMQYNAGPIDDAYSFSGTYGLVMMADGEELYTISVAGGRDVSLAFDAMNNLYLTWSEDTGTDGLTDTSADYTSSTASDVWARLYTVDGAIAIDNIAINSANTLIAQWPGYQGDSQVTVDADGDLTVVFEGVGPDVSMRVNESDLLDYLIDNMLTYDANIISDLANALGISGDDALDLVVEWIDNAYAWTGGVDTDILIDDILAQAQKALSDEDLELSDSEIVNLLGRMNTLLEYSIGLLRGERYGIFYTQFDANALDGDASMLYTDAVVNTQRDGSNQTINIVFDNAISSGSFILRVYDPYDGDVSVDVSVPIVFVEDTEVIDWDATLDGFRDGLNQAMAALGKGWAEDGDATGIVANVRLLGTAEITALADTYWNITTNGGTQIDETNADLYWVIQVTFEGSSHDIAIAYEYENALKTSKDEVQYIYIATNSEGTLTFSMGEEETYTFNYVPGSINSTTIHLTTGIASLAQKDEDAESLSASHVVVTPLDPVTIDGVVYEVYEVVFTEEFGGIDQETVQWEITLDADGYPTGYQGDFYSVTATEGGEQDAFLAMYTYVYADTGFRQDSASSAMQSNGTFIVAYTNWNTDYSTSIMVRTFTEGTDTAGPSITSVETDVTPADENVTGNQVALYSTVASSDGVAYLIFNVSEALYCVYDVETQLEQLGYTEDKDLVGTVSEISGLTLKLASSTLIAQCQEKWDMSVLNPDCYSILLNDVELGGCVVSVNYGLNEANTMGIVSTSTNKYQIVLTLDSDTGTAGNQALEAGEYSLIVYHYINDSGSEMGQAGLCDAEGNSLGLNGYTQETNGEDFEFSFSIANATDDGDIAADEPGDPDEGTTDTAITTTTDGEQSDAVVATASDGSYVVIWVDYSIDADGDIVGQRYDADGTAVGTEFTVSRFTYGEQMTPSVSMNDDGSFVVVWYGVGTDGYLGVYARKFNANGKAATADIRVTQISTDFQLSPCVAISEAGSFVVAWTEYDPDTLQTHIYARRYDKAGNVLGDAFQVDSGANATNGGASTDITAQIVSGLDIALAADTGYFVIVWQSSSKSTAWDIYGQLFDASGNKVGKEFRANAYTTNNQTNPSVSMDDAGDFVVSWTSYGQDGSGYGVYARQYNASGMATTTKEFLVNETTVSYQLQSDVACAEDGDFVIVWTAYGQDDPLYDDYGIYARMYLSDGSNFVNSDGDVVGEFRVNATTLGDQVAPSVSRNASNGDYIVVWLGPDYSESTDVFSRRLDPPVATETTAVAQGPTISSPVVVTTASTPTITWTVSDNSGIVAVTLYVDGEKVTIDNSYGDDYAAQYTAALSSLAAGSHAYIITATSAAGVSSQVTGVFTIYASGDSANMTISGVVIDLEAGAISWTVTSDEYKILSSILTIDGVEMKVDSKFGTSYRTTYTAKLGDLTSGDHAYTIVAVDASYTMVGYADTFTVEGATNAAPAISKVVVSASAATPVITCNVADTDGVASVIIKIDGAAVTVFGPYGTQYDGNYAGKLGTLSEGSHTYTITATDAKGVLTTTSGTFTVGSASTSSAPTISSIVAATSAATPVITCKVADTDGVASVVIKIDGTAITVYGPYGTQYDGNYAGKLGTLSAGSHTYTITATDAKGVTSTSTGAFTVAGTTTGSAPTISSIVAATSAATPVITCNVADTDGVASVVIKIDGTAITVFGPYGTKYDGNYAGRLGTLSAGSHTYTITATDANGEAATKTGTFTVTASSTTSAPTIANVVVALSASTPVITWNVTDTDGAASVTLKIDGVSKTVYGPYGTKFNGNYAGVIGSLSTGSHTYVITAVDTNGVSGAYTGTFTVASSSSLVDAVVSGISSTSDLLVDYDDAATDSDDGDSVVDVVFATY